MRARRGRNARSAASRSTEPSPRSGRAPRSGASPATGPTASSMTGVPDLETRARSAGRAAFREGRPADYRHEPSRRPSFEKQRRVDDVLLRHRRFNQAKPAVSASSARSPCRRSPTHGAGGERIADQDLSGESGCGMSSQSRGASPGVAAEQTMTAGVGRGRRRDRPARGSPRGPRRPRKGGSAPAVRLGPRARRSCPARQTTRPPAGWPSPSGSGRRPPASPCRASARPPRDGLPRRSSRRGPEDPARAGNRESGECARRAGRRRPREAAGEEAWRRLSRRGGV